MTSEPHDESASVEPLAPPTAQGGTAVIDRSVNQPPARTPERMIPWLSIWIHPRRTMRWLLEHRTPKQAMPLLLIAGYLGIVEMRADQEHGDSTTIVKILSSSLGWSLLYFVLIYFCFGWLLQKVARAMKGAGALRDTRMALCWMSLPGIVTSVVTLGGGVALFGADFFSAAKWDRMDANPALSLAFLATLLFQFAFLAPSMIVGVGVFAEAHRFAWWRSLLTLLLLGFALAGVVMVVIIAVAIVGNATP